MEPVALKYDLFGEQPKALVTLQTFAANYGSLRSGLQAVWEQVQDEKSKTEQIRAHLAKAHEALQAAAGLGARFFRKDGSTAPPRDIGGISVYCGKSCGELFQAPRGRAPAQCPHCSTDYTVEEIAAYLNPDFSSEGQYQPHNTEVD